jgi:hypothetical protein
MRWKTVALGLLATLLTVDLVVYLVMSRCNAEESRAKPAPPPEAVDQRDRRPEAVRSAAEPPASAAASQPVLSPDEAPAPDQAPATADAGESPVAAQLRRCCADVTRLRAAGQARYRAVYDGIVSQCDGPGSLPFDQDKEVVLDGIRRTVSTSRVPAPASCR